MRGVRYGLIVLVIGAAAACTSDGGSSPTDTPTTPPPSTTSSTNPTTPSIVRSPSPSVATTGPNVRPGEKPPVLPALAKTNSRPGAAAFAYYWFRALDWGYATTDSTLAKTLYLPQCKDCSRFVGIFDRVKSDAQHFVGGRVTTRARNIVTGDKRHPGTTVLDVTIDVEPLRTLDAKGRVVDRNSAQKGLQYRLWCEWAAGWRLRDYKRLVTS